eukprot:scaffold117064_cov45-Phaeocystis_antarctica.AAC.1
MWAWQADKTPVNSAFGATTGRAAMSEKNGRFGYARGVFHEETTSGHLLICAHPCPEAGSLGTWPRPEFRQILFEISA